MSLLSLTGLNNLPPEIANALMPVLQQLETHLDDTVKATLDSVNKIVESALDRIDGAQVVAVVTIKLPQANAAMAQPPDDSK